MKKIFLAAIASLCCLFSFSQDTSRANQLVQEGIAFHDNSQYPEAIAKYKEALAVLPGFPRALYELSYTYSATGAQDSSILLDEQLLKMPVSDDIKRQVYVTLGSAYDDNHQPAKAEKTYEEGIKKFPDFYLLYFNLGITKYSRNASDVDDAQALFEKTLSINPFHAGSHYLLCKTMIADNKTAALLPACMLTILERKTNRATECALFTQDALLPKVKSDSANKNFTIYLPMKSSKPKENDFSIVDMSLSLLAASSQIADSLQLKTQAQKLDFSLQMFCGMMGESGKNKGFFWKYYAPFFSEMKEKKYTDVLAHRILFNADAEPEDWLITNQSRVDEFYTWVKNYSWYKQK